VIAYFTLLVLLIIVTGDIIKQWCHCLVPISLVYSVK